MRTIDSIFVHCTATKTGRDVTAKEIRNWHVNGQGWSDIGYHEVVRLDGKVEKGRGVSRMGAHTRGYNRNSLGIVLVGGVGPRGRPMFNYTQAQMASLKERIEFWQGKYNIPKDNVWGHNEVSSKACPCFDVDAWLSVGPGQRPPRDPTDVEGF